jgi:hypothetical protein
MYRLIQPSPLQATIWQGPRVAGYEFTMSKSKKTGLALRLSGLFDLQVVTGCKWKNPNRVIRVFPFAAMRRGYGGSESSSDSERGNVLAMASVAIARRNERRFIGSTFHCLEYIGQYGVTRHKREGILQRKPFGLKISGIVTLKK